MEQKRKSNFELLRIFAMLMIIAHHFAVHSDFQFPSGFTTINRVWIQFIAMGGKIGVNIFVMISGYFLVNSTKMKWSKVFKIWSQLVFYAVVIYLAFVFIGLEKFSVEGLKLSFFPVGRRNWWFASTYLVLYVFAPYINQLIKSINKQQLQKLLVIMTVLWCILPTFTDYSYESSFLLWFIYVYCIGGYLRIYGIYTEKLDSKRCLFIAIASTLLHGGISVYIDYLNIHSGSVFAFAEMFYSMQSLAILLISLFAFLAFAKLEIKYSRVINTVSATTFGVYLIHDDSSYIRRFLWNTILKSSAYTLSRWFVLYSILIIGFVFIVCCMVELLRLKYVENVVMKMYESIKQNIMSKVKIKRTDI